MASADTGQLYFCHQCTQAVRPMLPGELICPNCAGDFLEEWSGPAPNVPPSRAYPPGNPWEYMVPGFGQVLEDLSSLLTHMHMVQAAEGGARGTHIRVGADPGNINPMAGNTSQFNGLQTVSSRLGGGANGPRGQVRGVFPEEEHGANGTSEARQDPH